MQKYLFLVLALVGFSSTTVFANCTQDRPGLIRVADLFNTDLETFDELLHETHAPSRLIEIVHHFEEGILEFEKALREGASCRDAIEEFQHFHEDIQLIYAELKANPQYFYSTRVLNAWNRLLPSFVRLQNRLYW